MNRGRPANGYETTVIRVPTELEPKILMMVKDFKNRFGKTGFCISLKRHRNCKSRKYAGWQFL